MFRARLATVVDIGAYHRRVHLFFRDLVFKETTTSGLELSTPVYFMFDSIHKATLDKLGLDQIFNESLLIIENAAPKRRFDFLLCVAEIGRANTIIVGADRCSTKGVGWFRGCAVARLAFWGGSDMTMSNGGKAVGWGTHLNASSHVLLCIAKRPAPN